MRSLGSWLITFFLIMFWAFRVVVAVTGTMQVDFVTAPSNVNVEVVLLFVVLICIPFIFKRKIIGAIVCMIAYGWYFGPSLIQSLLIIFEGQTLGLEFYLEVLISAIGVLLPLLSIFDILLDKSRTKNPIDKQTDWFYKNEQYDRKLDERADKNHYKTL